MGIGQLTEEKWILLDKGGGAYLILVFSHRSALAPSGSPSTTSPRILLGQLAIPKHANLVLLLSLPTVGSRVIDDFASGIYHRLV